MNAPKPHVPRPRAAEHHTPQALPPEAVSVESEAAVPEAAVPQASTPEARAPQAPSQGGVSQAEASPAVGPRVGEPAGTVSPAAEPSPAVGPAASSPRPSRSTLIRWLLATTRPVLPPLLASTACRIADLLAGVGLFAVASYGAVRAGVALAAGQPMPAIWPILALMVALSLAKAFLRYGEQFMGHFVAFKALELIRAEIFTALIPRAPRVMTTSRSGDLLTRATKDVDRIEVFFAHTFAPAVSAVAVPATVVVAIGLGTRWELAAIAAAYLVAAILIVPLAGWKASLAASRRVAGRRAALAQHVTDSVQGLAEVVGYGRVEERLDEMQQADRGLSRAAWPAAGWASLRRGTIELLVLAGPITLALVGAGMVRGGTVSLAALAASVAGLLRLAETIRGVEEFAASLNASFASAERVWSVVHAPNLIPDGEGELPAAPHHEVEWRGVHYRYPGAGSEAIRGVSLVARAGEWTCLVGASGSGKTTLAGLPVRMDDPSSGQVLVGGVPVSELRAESLRAQVMLVTQKAHLFRASVADNVRLAAPGASDAEVEAACRAAGIHDDIAAMERGYSTLVGERGVSVSGGQRQRIALARALLARPAVLILDEFTSHLDPALDAQVRSAVRQWLPQATIIEVTHRLTHLEGADWVAVVDAGRVVEVGRPGELAARGGALSRL